MLILTLSLNPGLKSGNKSITYCLTTLVDGKYVIKGIETLRFPLKNSLFKTDLSWEYSQTNFKNYYQRFFKCLFEIYNPNRIICEDYRFEASEYHFLLLSIFNELNHYVFYFNVNNIIINYPPNENILRTTANRIIYSIGIPELTRYYQEYHTKNLYLVIILSYHFHMYPEYLSMISF